MRRRVLPLVAALMLAGCGGDETAPTSERAATEDRIEELTNVLGLRSDFEADAGSTRVILLLSPT